MKFYLVTARTARQCVTYHAIAPSSGQAAEDTASMFDEPCGITVVCLG